MATSCWRRKCPACSTPKNLAKAAPVDEARSLAAAGFCFAHEEIDGLLHLRALHRPDFKPICADWQDAPMRSRIQAGRRQLLARACGLHKTTGLHILDGTAGLGRDGYTLAALGARVTLCERNAGIAALLTDALRRATLSSPGIAARIDIVSSDTRSLLHGGAQWDVIYLDPMYPETGKTALPQRQMQMLRDLTGGDADADALLAPALAAARKRVVIKRPLKAPPLAGREPSLQIKGTQARFDVYLPCAY